MKNETKFDVAVIGAGVFGGWTAWHLSKRGKRVLLLDAYGPSHSRASSGGESRIIRMSYGGDELYTRWSQNSLVQWKEFFGKTKRALFHKTGVLWLAGGTDSYSKQSVTVLKKCGVPFEEIQTNELIKRYPQINFENVSSAILETESGVLMARNAVHAVVADAIQLGATYELGFVQQPIETKPLLAITTNTGAKYRADEFIFACGSWLPKMFPAILGQRIFPTRQEVFFFGVPAGNSRFLPENLPTWLFQEDEIYGMPDLENRGLKIAFDSHGEPIDPDTQSRIVTPQKADAAKAYVARRFPDLRNAPIVETRVCQYENTSNGDFLIDHHPEMDNVWFAGGGSGHGFKHGPAFGEYVTGQLLDNAPAEPRFSLASKLTTQKRVVF